MASKLCLNLVWKKAMVRRPWRAFSSVAATAAELKPLRSSPRLVLFSEEVSDATSAADDNHNMVKFHYFNLTDMSVGKLTKKLQLPRPLWEAHRVGSSHGWLAYMNHRDLGFYLVDIFSPSICPGIIPLPSIQDLPPVVRPIPNPKSRRHGSTFIDEVVVYNHDFECEMVVSTDWLAWTQIKKLALSSPPSSLTVDGHPPTAMIIYGPLQKLAFCSIGEDGWTRVLSPQTSSGFQFLDVIYSNKDRQFYAISTSGDIEAWDVNLQMSEPDIVANDDHHALDIPECWDYRDYLVESPSGDLLRVRRFCESYLSDGSIVEADEEIPYRTVRFEVWKLDFGGGGKGEYLENIGEMALFVGFNHSFSVSVSMSVSVGGGGGDFVEEGGHELKANCIYFTDDDESSAMEDNPYGGHDFGIYNLEDQSVSPLFPCELMKILPAPIWVAPPNPNPNP